MRLLLCPPHSRPVLFSDLLARLYNSAERAIVVTLALTSTPDVLVKLFYGIVKAILCADRSSLHIPLLRATVVQCPSDDVKKGFQQ